MCASTPLQNQLHYFAETTNDAQTKGKENSNQSSSGYNVNTLSIKRTSMIIPLYFLLCPHERCVKHLAATYNNVV